MLSLLYRSCVLCLIRGCRLGAVPQVGTGSSWCLTGYPDTRELEEDQRVEDYSRHALQRSTCASGVFILRVKFGVR